MDPSTCGFFAQITATLLIASSVSGFPKQYETFTQASRLWLFLVQIPVPAITIFIGATAAGQHGLDAPWTYVLFGGFGITLGGLVATTHLRYTNGIGLRAKPRTDESRDQDDDR